MSAEGGAMPSDGNRQKYIDEARAYAHQHNEWCAPCVWWVCDNGGNEAGDEVGRHVLALYDALLRAEKRTPSPEVQRVLEALRNCFTRLRFIRGKLVDLRAEENRRVRSEILDHIWGETAKSEYEESSVTSAVEALAARERKS